MRVIAGSARSLRLKTIEGLDTRPTTDRIKETLFNMINADVYGCRFLDLFAGSGAIGIEALSRGAREAVFVENSSGACACIKENLSFTRLNDSATLIESDCITAIKSLNGKGVFDIIFMDPPYNHRLEKSVLCEIKNTDIVDEFTTIIYEAALDTDDSFVEDTGFTITRIKKYKTNKHVFVQMKRI